MPLFYGQLYIVITDLKFVGLFFNKLIWHIPDFTGQKVPISLSRPNRHT